MRQGLSRQVRMDDSEMGMRKMAGGKPGGVSATFCSLSDTFFYTFVWGREKKGLEEWLTDSDRFMWSSRQNPPAAAGKNVLEELEGGA